MVGSLEVKYAGSSPSDSSYDNFLLSKTTQGIDKQHQGKQALTSNAEPARFDT